MKDRVEGLCPPFHRSIRVGRRRSRLSPTFSGEARLHLRHLPGFRPNRVAVPPRREMAIHVHRFANGCANHQVTVRTSVSGRARPPRCLLRPLFRRALAITPACSEHADIWAIASHTESAFGFQQPPTFVVSVSYIRLCKTEGIGVRICIDMMPQSRTKVSSTGAQPEAVFHTTFLDTHKF